MSAVVILIAVLTVCILLFIFLPIAIYRNNNIKVPRETQWKVSDKDILLIMSKQRNGYLSPDDLARITDLTKSEAKKRLFSMVYKRAISFKQSGLKYYFHLKEEVDSRQAPQLSNNPYITTADLMLLFKHHNFELTLQKICIDTGLPINVIYKELQRFIKEKVIVKLSDRFFNVSYILKEPYNSNPEKRIDTEDILNLDLSKIYQKEMRR